MLQNSNGTFSPKPYTSVTPGGYTNSVVTDINQDGKADIIAVNSGPVDDHADPLGPATLTIYLGNGNATFTMKSPINLAGAQGAAYDFCDQLSWRTLSSKRNLV